MKSEEFVVKSFYSALEFDGVSFPSDKLGLFQSGYLFIYCFFIFGFCFIMFFINEFVFYVGGGGGGGGGGVG